MQGKSQMTTFPAFFVSLTLFFQTQYEAVYSRKQGKMELQKLMIR